MLPLIVIVATSFTELNYVSFPPHGFTLKWYAIALQKTEFISSFLYSVSIGICVAIISTVIGCLVAVALTRFSFPGRSTLDAFFMSPLILPTIVIGIALLQYINRIGLGVSLPLLVMSHVIITTPYAIRLVAASLIGIDASIERAARNLGAPPVRAFVKVVVPLIAPGLTASAVFTFIASFDNVTISIFLSSPRNVTLPVRIFNMWDQPIEPWLIAICSLVIALTAVLIALIERTIGIGGAFDRAHR
jgi:putative spermidine/putrescine transport system permease protein